MVKNFFEYVKELIPEKGSAFFTRENHEVFNVLSLYKLADLLSGEKIKYASAVTGYSWKVDPIVEYNFPTMGLFVLEKTNGLSEELEERWIHFSQHAFVGAICIVATRNDITFDDPEYEALRQVWQRRIENREQEEDKVYTEAMESNFEGGWFYSKISSNIRNVLSSNDSLLDEEFINRYRENPSLLNKYPESLNSLNKK